MPPTGGVLAPAVMRILRQAVVSSARISRAIHTKLSQPLVHDFQHVSVRASPSPRQPIHPAAISRQFKRAVRWASSSSSATSYTRLDKGLRRSLTTALNTPRSLHAIDRTAFTKTSLGRAFAQFPGRAPFAHTLRPNLTGGTLPRTAGGYALPGSGRLGGPRYFSHAPASHAHVVQNVSQAMRAFWLSGHRARFDGYNASGHKTYRPVTSLHDSSLRTLATMPPVVPGSVIEFHLAPQVTALSPLAAAAAMAAAARHGVQPAVSAATLHADGFLDVLATDFARQFKLLTAVMTDLKRLAALGDLPIVMESHNTLRVRFPGLDADAVARLCDDVGVQHGIVKQDAEFDPSYGASMALGFPYAPNMPGDMPAHTSPGGSLRSHLSELSSLEADAVLFEEIIEQDSALWSDPSPTADAEDGYESMSPPVISSAEHVSEFEGLEGIHRFLEECDYLKSRF